MSPQGCRKMNDNKVTIVKVKRLSTNADVHDVGHTEANIVRKWVRQRKALLWSLHLLQETQHSVLWHQRFLSLCYGQTCTWNSVQRSLPGSLLKLAFSWFHVENMMSSVHFCTVTLYKHGTNMVLALRIQSIKAIKKTHKKQT